MSLKAWITHPWLGLLLMAAILCTSTNLAIAQDSERVRKAKIAFVYKIAKFVRWSETTGDTSAKKLAFCFYKQDVWGSAYQQIASKMITGRTPEPRVVEQARQLSGCDILLVSPMDLKQFHVDVARNLPNGLLTVADLTTVQKTGIARDGIVVGLVRRGSKMAFEVNLQQARRQQLGFSSELLKLAIIVAGAQR
jgi:YfiR/HmsC-like